MSVVLTYVGFVNDGRFAPFSELSESQVQPAIDAAHRMWDETSCGSLYTDIVTYQTAVLLSTGWSGAPASKYRPPGETPYDHILAQLSRGCVASGVLLNKCP